MAALSHKRQDYQQLFVECLLETFKFLAQIYSDHKHLKRVEHKFLKLDRTAYMEYTLNNLKPHITHICSQDESIFSPDYTTKPLFLLVGLDFKKIWRPEMSDEHKTQLFTQLQMLFIYGSLALKVNKLLVRDMIENLKFTTGGELDQKVAEAEAEAQAKSQFSLESIFGKNNPIADLLIEVIQDQTLRAELGLPNIPIAQNQTESTTNGGPTSEGHQTVQGGQSETTAQDPTTETNSSETTAQSPLGATGISMESLTGLFKPDKLQKLIATFKTRLEAKMEARDLSYDDIKQYGCQISDRLRRKFAQNPILKALQVDKIIDQLMESVNRAEDTETLIEEPTPDFQAISQNLMGMLNNLQQQNQHLQVDPQQAQQIQAVLAQMRQQNHG